MDFKLSPEQERFRADLRQWLEANGPGDWGRIRSKLSTREAQAEFLIAWQRKLHAAGYVGLHWPTAYGGRGATVLEQAIFYEEMARARAPELPNAIGLDMAGPALIAHATEKQKQAHLPKILSAEHIFCQGFSEPNAGSDLAAVQTRAERKNGYFVINGQKVWTSYAHYANWCILLTRTDPSAPRHRGLTFFLVDMASPGFTVKPLRQMSGDAEFNELYFDNLEVPTENVVGETWQRTLELGLELQGPYASLWQGSPRALEDGWWQFRALRSRGDTIAGGTSEIMKNILAERVLGLPKD